MKSRGGVKPGRGQGTESVKVDTILSVGQGNERIQSGLSTSYTCSMTVNG